MHIRMYNDTRLQSECKYEFMYISQIEVNFDKKEVNLLMMCVRSRLLHSYPVHVLARVEERYILAEFKYNNSEYESN